MTSAAVEQQPPLPDAFARRTPTRAFFAICARDIGVTVRTFPTFLIETLLNPLLFLFIFGRILPDLGFASTDYADVLLPGIVGITIVVTAMQSIALPLVLEFGYTKEIEDRLLAPLGTKAVALEKIVIASLRGLLGGVLVFPLAIPIIVGENPSGDAIPRFVLFFLLSALLGSGLGLTLGTFVQPRFINLMFAAIYTPLFFTGCVQYPWATLDGLRWFQIVTLFNPLTYVSEGLRGALSPEIEQMDWLLAAGVSVAAIVVFVALGLRGFARRAVD